MESGIDEPFPGALLYVGHLLFIAGREIALLLAAPDPSLFFYGLNGFVLILLLMLSALISGAEVALFSLSADEVALLKKSDIPSGQKVAALLDHPKRLLANILILNNLVNVAFITLSTFICWEISGAVNTEFAVVAALVFMVTFCIVFFGEIVPKVYANQKGIHVATRSAPFLRIADYLLWPISWLLMNMDNFVEKRITKKGAQLTVNNLQQALETAVNSSEEEKVILKGIVNFGTLSAKQVMQPRLDITAFDIASDFHELMNRINKSGHSRVPVYRETIDKIEGVLYIKDLLPYLDNKEDFEWQPLLRPGFFIPEGKKIDDLLRDFQEKRVHMAIVVDEYGGTSGLITLEDIIEEIVGEINDEFDNDEIPYSKLGKNTYIFEGKTSLQDFCKIAHVDPATFENIKGESESLGGLLLELYSKLPRVGEKVKYDNFVFTVVSVDSRRIKRVRVFIKEGNLG